MVAVAIVRSAALINTKFVLSTPIARSFRRNLRYFLSVVANILIWASSSSSIADENVHPPSLGLLGTWTPPSQAAIDTNRTFTQCLDLYHMVWIWIL